jgi:hypothetical protein
MSILSDSIHSRQVAEVELGSIHACILQSLKYYLSIIRRKLSWISLQITQDLSWNISLYVVPVILGLHYRPRKNSFSAHCYSIGRGVKTERTELLALIYKGWRTSGAALIPIIFPVYILRWNSGYGNRESTRTKESAGLGQETSEGMTTSPSLVRYYYSSDVHRASSIPCWWCTASLLIP